MIPLVEPAQDPDQARMRIEVRTLKKKHKISGSSSKRS